MKSEADKSFGKEQNITYAAIYEEREINGDICCIFNIWLSEKLLGNPEINVIDNLAEDWGTDPGSGYRRKEIKIYFRNEKEYERYVNYLAKCIKKAIKNHLRLRRIMAYYPTEYKFTEEDVQ